MNTRQQINSLMVFDFLRFLFFLLLLLLFYYFILIEIMKFKLEQRESDVRLCKGDKLNDSE